MNRGKKSRYENITAKQCFGKYRVHHINLAVLFPARFSSTAESTPGSGSRPRSASTSCTGCSTFQARTNSFPIYFFKKNIDSTF